MESQTPYERLLTRAWSAVYHCYEMADSQSRYTHQRRLKFCMKILEEVQLGINEELAMKQRAMKLGVYHELAAKELKRELEAMKTADAG
jgi:hypothetical protein